jgi:hypothetical protein
MCLMILCEGHSRIWENDGFACPGDRSLVTAKREIPAHRERAQRLSERAQFVRLPLSVPFGDLKPMAVQVITSEHR